MMDFMYAYARRFVTKPYYLLPRWVLIFVLIWHVSSDAFHLIPIQDLSASTPAEHPDQQHL